MASAEIYNPAAGTWTPTGSLITGRANFQMVLLQNGNVLAAGGTVSGGLTATAEIYNYTTGQWTATGNLVNGREDFQAVLLLNGNVLAAGGRSRVVNSVGNLQSLASAEIYNFTTGTWALTGALANGRYYFQMVLLPNGNVLAAGGAPNTLAFATASAEVFSPAMSTWTTTGSLATARIQFQMVLLPTGIVIAAGGSGVTGANLASTELYNLTTGTWPYTGTFAIARSSFQMAVL